MSEFDADVLKRSLPPDIHAVVDQVKANVDLAVASIVNEFKEHARKVVTDFQNQNYTEDLKSAIQKQTDAFQEEVKQMDAAFGDLNKAATKAAELTRNIQDVGLKQAVAEMVQLTGDLQGKLKNFKQKSASFGQTVGGAIATAAVKTFTGGAA